MGLRPIRRWPNAIGLVRLRAHPSAPLGVMHSHRELRTRHRSDEGSVPPEAQRTAVFVRNVLRAGHGVRRRRVPKPQWPFALEREYASDLVAIITELRRTTDAALAELPALVESARREREDAMADAELELAQEVVGLRIVIENPAGSIRTWTDSDGTTGWTVMKWGYGFLDGYEGADGEDVDVYRGPVAEPREVYVIHQRRKGAPDATEWPVYDEDKVMLGWDSADAAKAAYLAQYDDPRFFGGMSVFTVDDFKRRLRANPGRKLTHAVPRHRRRLRLDVGEGRRARMLLDRARDSIAGGGASQAEHAAAAAAADVSEHQRKQLGKQSKAALGVDITPLLADPKMAARIDAFVHENVSLIKSLGTNTLDELEKLITRGLADGMRAEQLGAEIAKRWGIAERHARLIARDQIGKLNGQITRARHKELGIARFRWLTMRDPKVRPRHRPMEGKVFAYEGADVPPFFPGQEICCRCQEEPVFDDILAELDALLAAPTTPPLPQSAPPPPQPPPPPPEDRPGYQVERHRMTQASLDARAAAAEDLQAYDAHQAKEKAWAAKVQAAKEKQAKALAEHKAKLAAEQAAKEAAAKKAAEEAAKKAAEEAAKKAAQELAAKQAAEALAAKKAAAVAKAKATRAANKARKEAERAAAAAAQAAQTGTVKYAAMAPSDFAGFHGRGFAQDADAIEGGSVRVVKVNGSDGEYFEAVFKLTSPYGQAARKFGTEDASSWTFRQRELRNGGLHDAGRTETMPNTARVRRGARRGNVVEIGTSGALTNQVRIRATSLAELDTSLADMSSHLGVDLSKTPSREDIALQAKARLAAKFDPKAFGSRMQAVTTPAQQREVIETVFANAAAKNPIMNAALADARIEEVYPGHHTLYSESLGKHMAKQWGALYHDGNPPADIAARVVGETGLMSSVKRYNSGVFTTGMSTSTDFRTGGADGVFLRVSKTTPSSSGGRFRAVVDTSKVMGRMDWWAFSYDNYGRAGYREYSERWSIPDQLGTSRPGSGNEVMATHGVPPSAFKKFIVSDEGYRRQVLAELSRMGVKEINGTPVEQFVVTR